MEKKFIIYIGQIIPPDKNAVAQRVYANAKLLKKCGYIPIIIGCDKNITCLKRIDDVYSFETYVLPYPTTTKQWVYRMISIKQYIKIFNKVGKENIKAVITCDLQSIAQIKMQKYLNKNKIIYIEDTMEWIRHSRKKSLKSIIKDIDTFFRMKFIHLKTKNIICISDFLFKYYKNKNCNVVNIPVLIDYYDKKWDIKMKYIPNKVRKFVYAGDAGSIGYKERLDKVMIAACQLLESGYNIVVEIIGITKSEFEKKCPNIAKNKNFTKIARFFGRQPHSFCLEKIKQADFSILIRENTREMKAGFPTKLSETLRLGTPPLITFIGDFENYLTDNVDCIKLLNTSIQEIYNAMRKICEFDDEKLISMHNNCLSNHKFDITNYENQFKEFLNKIIY